MKTNFFQVDAFTEKPFSGNPAAVFLPGQVLDTALMQAIAMENNLAETAFLEEREDGFSLRWFTPSTEVDLCGHATLASAHVLWETGKLPAGAEARFHTRSGLLTAVVKDGWIELDFPAFPVEHHDTAELPENIAAALQVSPVSISRSGGWHLIELESEEAVGKVRPDFRMLGNEDPVIVTCRGSGKYDFVSRFFAPSHGINEDPVTGSAHCRLVPYWAGKLGRNELFAFQASPRGGELKLKLENERVKIAGKAVTIITGHFMLNI